MNPSFWKNKKVFVTGHTGFKGAWLSAWLRLWEAELLGFSLAPPTKKNLYTLIKPKKGIQSVLGDVRNLKSLSASMRRFKPEIVIHMAAQSLVKKSYEDPLTTYQTNVMGTANLLEAIRDTKSVRSVVVVTSDKCYDENAGAKNGHLENDPMGGTDPYSSSKGCAELVVKSYRAAFFGSGTSKKHAAAIATARAGNVIGGGDWAENRLVPDAIRSFWGQKEMIIRNPNAIRPWQHVLEPLSGYLLLAEKLYRDGAPYAQGWNFGPKPSDAKPVSWVADRLMQLWGEGAQWKKDGAFHPKETHILKLNCSKSMSRLGWKPKMNLELALSWVVEWSRAYQDGASMDRVTEDQIKQYLKLK